MESKFPTPQEKSHHSTAPKMPVYLRALSVFWTETLIAAPSGQKHRALSENWKFRQLSILVGK